MSVLPVEEIWGIRVWHCHSVCESMAALLTLEGFPIYVAELLDPLASVLPITVYLAFLYLVLTRRPHLLGLSAGFWSVWTYAQTGWRLEARIKALMRDIVLRSFRELLLPRVSECRHTRLSVIWITLVFRWCLCSTRHRNAVKIARNSRELMCSRPRVHFHPVTTDHLHNFAGTVARRRWCLISCVVGVVSNISSPLVEMRLPSLNASSEEASSVRSRGGWSGKRTSRPWAVQELPGSNASKTSWGVRSGMKPSLPKSWDKSQATTGTLHELPNRVSLASV